MLFRPRQTERLFSLLDDALQNLQAAAGTLRSLAEAPEQTPAMAVQLRELERRGDELTQQLLTQLNTLSRQPEERQDFLNLSLRIDDVIDGIEAAAFRLEVYQLAELDPHVVEFARIIDRQVREVAAGLAGLSRGAWATVQEHASQVGSLEHQGDEVLRAALIHLFGTESSPIRIMQRKEVYELLEMVTDRAEDVVDALTGAVMKRA